MKNVDTVIAKSKDISEDNKKSLVMNDMSKMLEMR